MAKKLNEEWKGRATKVFALTDYYEQGRVHYRAWLEAAFGYDDATVGSHAGISDTSQMLLVNPAGIRKDQIKPWGGPADSGVSGDPTKATAEIGRMGIEFKVNAGIGQYPADQEPAAAGRRPGDAGRRPLGAHERRRAGLPRVCCASGRAGVAAQVVTASAEAWRKFEVVTEVASATMTARHGCGCRCRSTSALPAHHLVAPRHQRRAPLDHLASDYRLRVQCCAWAATGGPRRATLTMVVATRGRTGALLQWRRLMPGSWCRI